MASAEHERLVGLAAVWLKRRGFGVVATELRFGGHLEEPDAIGFRENCSALVEVKVSRSDFLADAKKPWRNGVPGLGLYRFYLSPPDVIQLDDLPDGWGLIHAVGKQLVDVVVPTGNRWPAAHFPDLGDWAKFQHPTCASIERKALYSIARRQTGRTS